MAKSNKTCASYALLHANVDNQESHPNAAKAIKWIFYMDGFSKSVFTMDECGLVYQNVRTTLQMGSFHLLNWFCNNEVFKRSVTAKDRSEAKNKTIEAEPQTSSLLGLQ